MRDGSGNWTQQAKLTAPDGSAHTLFGYSVSLDGGTALVSRHGDPLGGVGSSAGSAYVFVRSGTTWIQQAKLTASDGAADDLFGGSVSVNGDIPPATTTGRPLAACSTSATTPSRRTSSRPAPSPSQGSSRSAGLRHPRST
ncbi:MAG: hypothetical protein FJ312_05515 [SAR202 cluster bacterium]|nr:hypothetical protein [SAR202 cluster bacterium]